MIKSTPKADTLPEDLRKHWESAMADKFPMTIQEAAAYIHNHYGLSVNINGAQIEVSVVVKKQVPDNVMAIDPAMFERLIGSPMPQSLQYRYNTLSKTHEVALYEYVYIKDFRKSVIDDQLKDYKP